MNTPSRGVRSPVKPRTPVDADTKTLALWCGWVAILSGISAGAYLSQKIPEKPTISVVAEPPGPDIPARRFTFLRSARSPRDEKVVYELDAPDAEKLYDIQLLPKGAVIPEGGDRFEMVLVPRKPPKPEPPLVEELVRRPVAVRLRNGEGDSYLVDGDRGEARMDLDVIVLRTANPPRLTVSTEAPRDKRVFTDETRYITVDFKIADGRRLDYDLTVPIVVGGLTSSDVILGGAEDGTLKIESGAPGKSIVVSLRPGVAERGRGERWFTVGFVPVRDKILSVGDTSVKLTIPDPRVQIVWTASPIEIDRRKLQTTNLKVSLNKRYPDPVTVNYAVTSAGDPDFKTFGPPMEIGEKGSKKWAAVVPANEPSASSPIFSFPANDVVGGPDLTVDIKCVGVDPPGVADRPGDLSITTSDKKALDGRALVLAILTEDLADKQSRKGEEVLDQLASLARSRKGDWGDLVDGRVYLLEGSTRVGRNGKAINGTIRRFTPSDGIPGRAKPFPNKILMDDLLEIAYLAANDQFGERIRAREATFLIWCETREGPRAIRAQVETGQTKPPDDRWHLLLVGDPGDLARRLGERFPKSRSDGRPRFHSGQDNRIVRTVEQVLSQPNR